MDGATFSHYPHYSWFGVWRRMFPHEPLLAVRLLQVNHVMFNSAREHAHVRWVCRGDERRFQVPEHAVHFAPADGEEHVRIPKVFATHDFYMMLIPPQHLDEIVTSEGCKPPTHLRVMLGCHDAVLRTCIERLVWMDGQGESSSPAAVSEASRRLALRLAELNGGGRPDWIRDASVFDCRTMASLVEYIDAHLQSGPSLSDVALLVGLSPSHFAKKFRQSTGLSLHRFINRRRVKKSLDVLRVGVDSLAGVALGLGFSSQSHFTRLFSELTGMTPARYRKEFRPTASDERVDATR